MLKLFGIKRVEAASLGKHIRWTQIKKEEKRKKEIAWREIIEAKGRAGSTTTLAERRACAGEREPLSMLASRKSQLLSHLFPLSPFIAAPPLLCCWGRQSGTRLDAGE